MFDALRSPLFIQRDMKIIGKQFVFRRKFWLLDVPSLLPVQLLYAIPALRYTALIRLPRLLRVSMTLQFLSVSLSVCMYLSVSLG